MALERHISFTGETVYDGFILGEHERSIWVRKKDNKFYAKFGSMQSNYAYLMDIEIKGKTEMQAVKKLMSVAKKEYKRITKLTKRNDY